MWIEDSKLINCVSGSMWGALVFIAGTHINTHCVPYELRRTTRGLLCEQMANSKSSLAGWRRMEHVRVSDRVGGQRSGKQLTTPFKGILHKLGAGFSLVFSFSV